MGKGKEMIPSVTQVIAPFADFSGIPEAVLDHACQRGTKVHAACAAIASGLFPVVDAETAGYVKSFREWFDSTVVVVVGVEMELLDRNLGYTGHLDLLCRIKGDKGLTVCDLKTPVTAHVLWKAQLAAYRHLCETNGYDVRRAFSLRLSREGKVPIVTEYVNHGHDLAGFLAALSAWTYFKG